MNAETVVRALGGRWHGDRGLASCPVAGHGRGRGDRNPSLSISIGTSQPIVVHCHAGCSQDEVLGALTQRGLWSGCKPSPSTRRVFATGPDARVEVARRMWRHSRPLNGTPADLYLSNRGLHGESPELRYIDLRNRGATPATADGAMIVALRNGSGELGAVQLTYITNKGTKAVATPVRQTYGAMRDCAAQLSRPDIVLGLAEGVETAISASNLHHVPVWAVCGARLKDAPIPQSVREIVLFADHDEPGQSAATRARKVFSARGFKVSICIPDMIGSDWNDVILRHGGALS